MGHPRLGQTGRVRKPAVVSKGGIVAAQSRKAAEVGAEVLAAGGDRVDAVVATCTGTLDEWLRVVRRANDNVA